MEIDALVKKLNLSCQSQPQELTEVFAVSSLGLLFKKLFLFKKQPHLVVATPQDLEKIKSFLDVYPLPCPVFSLSSTSVLTNKEIKNARLKWLAHAASHSPSLFLTTPLALLKKTQTPLSLIVLKKGGVLPDFLKQGYQEQEFIHKKGDFSVRGYLIDVFSPAYDQALRLEVFEEKIQSLHLLSKDFKKREKELDKALLPALWEWTLSGEKRKSLCQLARTHLAEHPSMHQDALLKSLSREQNPEHLSPFLNALDSSCALDVFDKKPVLWMIEPEKVKKFFEQETQKIQTLHPLFKSEFLYLPWKTLEKKIQMFVRARPQAFSQNACQPFPSQQIKPSQDIKKSISHLSAKHLVFFSKNSQNEHKIKSQILNKNPSFVSEKTFYFLRGHLKENFVSSEGTAYLQAETFFTQTTESFVFFKQRFQSVEFSQLEKGDLVVHRQYGIGQFQGLETLKTQNQVQDFFILLYKNRDKLLLPAYKAKELKKYSKKFITKSSEHLLDSLGDPRRWENKQKQAKKYIQSITVDLIRVYKARKQSHRKSFDSATEDLHVFAQEFPFEETPAQNQALKEIFSDMDRSYPMNRLLCGDIGFGKTEVALRAAFRALSNGFQVCFLVPTTLLSLQHYNHFQKRLKDWPFEVVLLNRFVSAAKREKIFQNLNQGKSHFLISTHSVFSPHLSFKNLGLLIIDEEHRFGVKQKEKLSLLKRNLDILSLSATPIPRTLNMVFTGVKDISVIASPPQNRKPIEIALKSWEDSQIDSFIAQASRREKQRNGQILFVHNRIQSIQKRFEHLQALLPELKLACAHGKLKTSELEQITLDFFDKKIDLLVSTNIVESGLDIPQANTLFIDRAHEMGLSQIHQLKGRVGRSERQAYCYFLVPRRTALSPVAEERFSLLEKYKNLGDGFHLAMHDLESRGAGSLLGAEQSGHIHSLGEDLFFEILNETLTEEKQGFVNPEIQWPLSVGIPSSYIPDTKLKLLYYKSLSEAQSSQQLEQLKQEFLDNFGDWPEEVENLFSLLEIQLLCKQQLIKHLKVSSSSLSLTFHQKTKIPAEKILAFVAQDQWKIQQEYSLKIPLEKTNLIQQIFTVLNKLKDLTLLES